MTIDPEAFNAFEAAGWEGAAPGYDRFFSSVTGAIVDPLLDVVELRSGARLLDLATGPGYVARRAVERGATVVGVDVSEAMLGMARRGVPGAEFRRADIEKLPFADASFDAAVGNFAILHVGRPERVAAEARRVLREGGRVGLSAWDFPRRARLFGVFVDAVAAVDAPPPEDVPVGPSFFRFSEDAEFIGLLKEAGFADAEVRTIEFHHFVPSPDELWDGLLGGTVRTRALVLGQSDEQRGRIRDAFDELVAPYRTDAGLELPVSVKLACGRRA
jgi:ubiquinone/menaquinone biosynthesis C-methylase UbiE